MRLGIAEALRLALAVLRQLRASIRARVPEKYLMAAAYASNSLVLAMHAALGERLSEASPPTLLAELAAAAQLLLPPLLLDAVPLFHYLAALSFVAAGSLLGLAPRFPAYYYAALLAVAAAVAKLEPVLPPSPTLITIATRVRRALRRARLPRTVEELELSAKLGAVHIAGLAISLGVYAWRGYPPALLVAAYSAAALLFFLLNVGASPVVRPPRGRYSLALLFVLRYPLLFRVANRMKVRLRPLVERAGALIFELEYVAKHLAAAVWALMLLPPLLLLAAVTAPPPLLAAVVPGLCAAPLLLYHLPFLSMSARVRARRAGVEKELPLFLAYAAAMVSAGHTLYTVFRDLASGRGAQLLRAFTREARYFLSLVERQGLPEPRALERYAATHPSTEFRNFLLGYMHQMQLGGRISLYMEQKLVEALDALKRRMERYVGQVTTLAEVALTVLVLPALPMVVGFIIAPDIVYGMLLAQMLAFVPAVGLMFYAVASAIQPEFADEYRLTYAPSVVGAVAGLGLGLVLALQKLAAGVAIVVGAAALGLYLEYARHRRVFAEIERSLPQLFRDLSELRQLMPIAEALGRLAGMGYPRSVARVLQRMAALRAQGVRVSEQPWHSRSWFWRFTQFLLGRIEESGGGSPALFRQLMAFFTELNNILSSARASLRVYELVIYAIPAIFGVVAYSTLGIFAAMSQVSQGPELQALASEAAQHLGGQLSQLLRMLRGVDPAVLAVCDAIIVEMGFVLGLLAGKVVSGTLRDTHALAIAMLVAAAVVLVAPDLVQGLIARAAPLGAGP